MQHNTSCNRQLTWVDLIHSAAPSPTQAAPQTAPATPQREPRTTCSAKAAATAAATADGTGGWLLAEGGVHHVKALPIRQPQAGYVAQLSCLIVLIVDLYSSLVRHKKT